MPFVGCVGIFVVHGYFPDKGNYWLYLPTLLFWLGTAPLVEWLFKRNFWLEFPVVLLVLYGIVGINESHRNWLRTEPESEVRATIVSLKQKIKQEEIPDGSLIELRGFPETNSFILTNNRNAMVRVLSGKKVDSIATKVTNGKLRTAKDDFYAKESSKFSDLVKPNFMFELVKDRRLR